MKCKEISVPRLNHKRITEEICNFIKRIVEKAHAAGTVVGLSGGVDSSLNATLCVKALGTNRVLGVLMPTDFTPKQDIDDALNLADLLKITNNHINIQRVSERLFRDLGINQINTRLKIPRGNIYSRIRMIILYYYANLNNYLVVGTSDRSEALIGFFTKYGDGGADFFPTIHLYKTQVRELALYLGIPEKISKKPSSPQLYQGHKATDEIPLDYDRLDPVLVGLCDLNLPPKDVSHLTRIPTHIVEEIFRRHHCSKHKRSFPPAVKSF